MVALLKSDELIIKKEIIYNTTRYFLLFNKKYITGFEIWKYNIVVPWDIYPKETPILMNFRTTEQLQRMGYGRYLLTEIMKKQKFILCSYEQSEGFYRKCGLTEIRDKFHYTIFENL